MTAAVGFKPHPPEAIAIGLSNSLFAACAIAEGRVIGLGRVVGDGGLDFYPAISWSFLSFSGRVLAHGSSTPCSLA